MCAAGLAQSIHSMISRGLSGVYNVASRNSMSIYDIALEFSRIFQLDKSLIEPVSINFAREKFALAAKRPKDVSLDVSKIEKELNMHMPLIQDGIISFKESNLYNSFSGTVYNKKS